MISEFSAIDSSSSPSSDPVVVFPEAKPSIRDMPCIQPQLELGGEVEAIIF